LRILLKPVLVFQISLVPRNERHHRPSEENTIRTIITNFIQLKAQTASNEVLIALGLVYAVLLVLTMVSIISRNSAPSVKVVWCALAVLFPAVGIAVYCVRCIATVDKEVLQRLKPGPKYAPDQPST
jgi:phosphate/sulfate permease